jgi:hypothetical protein
VIADETVVEATSDARSGQRWHVPMVGRDRFEAHRAATPLELLFDLCFVVAVAQAAGALHDDLVAGEIGHGVISYLLVFFTIWWPWVNFTWFASAFDTDDVPYRLLTFVQIFGILVVTAGIPAAFDGFDLRTMVLGYVIMRIATGGAVDPCRDRGPGGAPSRFVLRSGLAWSSCCGWSAWRWARRGVTPRSSCWGLRSWPSRSGPSAPADPRRGTPSTSRRGTACSRSSSSASACWR